MCVYPVFLFRDEQEKANPILYYRRVVNYVIGAAAITTLFNLPFGGVALGLAGTDFKLCYSISNYANKTHVFYSE